MLKKHGHQGAAADFHVDHNPPLLCNTIVGYESKTMLAKQLCCIQIKKIYKLYWKMIDTLFWFKICWDQALNTVIPKTVLYWTML